jgi:hypothetical protein
MTAEEVTLSKNPDISGDVVYLFEFKINRGSHQEFDVEISDVDVQEIKNLVYDEDGSPVMMNEANKQKFTQTAYNHFWRRLVNAAEDKVIDKVRLGSW